MIFRVNTYFFDFINVNGRKHIFFYMNGEKHFFLFILDAKETVLFNVNERKYNYIINVHTSTCQLYLDSHLGVIDINFHLNSIAIIVMYYIHVDVNVGQGRVDWQ